MAEWTELNRIERSFDAVELPIRESDTSELSVTAKGRVMVQVYAAHYVMFLVFASIGFASFLSFLISPLVAWRKGYAPYYWQFACGPVGLVVVCCLRSLRSAETPEQYE